jgi:[acyl-carrier-protein] S-malonyltransferase
VRRGVTVANDNAPGQLVLSGEKLAIGLATVDLRALGIRTLELNVSGAFHSPLMAPAVPAFAEALSRLDVREPSVPVWSSVTARPMDDVRARLLQGLTWPVRWRETVLALHAHGIERFDEAGPGRVLTKMLKRTLPEAARA